MNSQKMIHRVSRYAAIVRSSDEGDNNSGKDALQSGMDSAQAISNP